MAGIAVLAVAYVLSQFYRSFLAVLTPALTADLGATKAELSFASGVWFIVFALMQFAVGVCLDRFGPRRTAATLLALGGGGGAMLFAVADSPATISIAMGLIGAGCSPVLMAPLFIFAKTFSPARFAVLTSWFVAIGSLGNVVGATPMAAAAEAFGWREVMVGLGIVTLLVAAAIQIIVRDPPQDESGAGAGMSGYLELLRMKVLWPIIPLMAINYAPPAGIRGLWAGPYLTEVYGLDALAIGNVTLFMALGMVAGSFLYGPLDTMFGTRKWVAAGGNVISLGAVICLAAFPLAGVPVATVLLVVIGVVGMGYGMIMAHARAFFPPHLTGRGVTLMNFFSIGGVGAMQFATGAVVENATVPGDPAAAYVALFGFYALLLAGSLVIYLFSRDSAPDRLPLPDKPA